MDEEKEIQQEKQGIKIPIQEALQQQFAKVGQMSWEMDIMRQQMIALENENKELKEQIKVK